MKVQILMSTYNGQKHIREQLDSLLAQTLWKKQGCDLQIMIRDDGSSDNTCKIIEEYADRCDMIKFIRGKNVGVISSFFQLINMVEKDVDYVALSDQDDVWMPEKLECAVNKLKKEDEELPLLYCGKPMLTDENLNPIRSIMYGNHVRPSFGNAMIENICTGCTAVFNYKLVELIQIGTPEFTVMHDWWLYLLASCFGKVFFDSNQHMYYRQHGDNTVGVQKNHWHELVARIKRFKANRYHISRQIKEFCRIYGKEPFEIPPEKKEWITLLLKAKKHYSARIRLVRNTSIYRQRKGDNFIFSLILLMGTV